MSREHHRPCWELWEQLLLRDCSALHWEEAWTQNCTQRQLHLYSSPPTICRELNLENLSKEQKIEMDAFNSFHSSSLKLKITCSLFLPRFSLKVKVCNWWCPTVSDRMRLFKSSSKEILDFITHQRHIASFSWKFIFLCQCWTFLAHWWGLSKLGFTGTCRVCWQVALRKAWITGALQQMWKAWTAPAQLSGKEAMLQ